MSEGIIAGDGEVARRAGSADPHRHQPVAVSGPRPSEARAGAILLHGRGGTAGDILPLAGELDLPEVAWLAPDAADRAWYPRPFLAPVAENEPALSSALRLVRRLFDALAKDGIPAQRTALVGFSQGACLALEFTARNPRRYGGVVGLSGGLIGAPGTQRDYRGSLDGTPVFLGCADLDPHIPIERVEETRDFLNQMGAEVAVRIYPGLGHAINRDEIEQARRIISRLIGDAPTVTDSFERPARR